MDGRMLNLIVGKTKLPVQPGTDHGALPPQDILTDRGGGTVSAGAGSGHIRIEGSLQYPRKHDPDLVVPEWGA